MKLRALGTSPLGLLLTLEAFSASPSTARPEATHTRRAAEQRIVLRQAREGIVNARERMKFTSLFEAMDHDERLRKAGNRLSAEFAESMVALPANLEELRLSFSQRPKDLAEAENAAQVMRKLESMILEIEGYEKHLLERSVAVRRKQLETDHAIIEDLSGALRKLRNHVSLFLLNHAPRLYFRIVDAIAASRSGPRSSGELVHRMYLQSRTNADHNA